jgi:hypothetical protein
VPDAVTSPLPEPVPDAAEEEPSRRPGRHRSVAQAGGHDTLVIAALGVVFGDIGTSPLYSLQTVFSLDHNKVQATPGDVYGVISLVFWSITLIVSVKYVTIIMRADNHGEGGVLALAALIRRMAGPRSVVTVRVILLALVGASLFYGDSVITPAISVLSAVEGLKVSAPSLADLVVPIAITILTILFVSQRFGTHRIGALFGPVMPCGSSRSGWPGWRTSCPTRTSSRGCRRATRRRSWPSARSSRSSRSGPSCCASPEPRPCTRTWATSAGRRSGGPGSSSSSRR